MGRIDGAVSLREISKETVRQIVKLKVAPEQEQFVASNGMSLAEAMYSPEVAWFRAIYLDETPVGFVMLSDNPIKPEYYLWRFMIDARYQRQGIGEKALRQVIDYVRTRPGAIELLTSVVPGDGSPGPFYEGLGFSYTGADDEGELVMRLPL
jgi:diamine N-acetyltransferase